MEIHFIKLNNDQIMSIIASENGLVENRILDTDSAYSESALKQASNYLNDKFLNNNIGEIKKNIEEEIINSKNKLEIISAKLVKQGILETQPSLKNPYIFMHGQSNLLKDELISKDLDQIRNLFDELEKKNNFC